MFATAFAFANTAEIVVCDAERPGGRMILAMIRELGMVRAAISRTFVVWASAGVLPAMAPAMAAPLTIVEVAAPGINCIYDPSCKITVTDSSGDIPVRGSAANGFLQSRTFVGAPAAPAAGKYGYEYRVSLTPAAAVAAQCVAAVKISFGPIQKMQYKDDAAPADVYVVTSGGVGTVGLASANQTGRDITFILARPVCASVAADPNATSYFFGLTAAGAPKPITAELQMTGGSFIKLPARAPAR